MGKKYAIYHIDLIPANLLEFEFLLAGAIGKSNNALYLTEWLVLFMNPCWVKGKKEREREREKKSQHQSIAER